MTARESGHAREPLPIHLHVIAVKPKRGRTPIWGRVLGHSHIVIMLGTQIWDQPIKGVGKAYDSQEWIKALGPGRSYTEVCIEVPDHDPLRFTEACKACEGRKAQKYRTILRWLRLWPKPAWNCTSPVRLMLNALDINVEGETPDDIITELTDARRRG